MIYLASPYTHPNDAVRQARYEAAFKFSRDLTEMEVVNFSPIAYGHQYALKGLPGDEKFWRKFNFAILSACSTLYILKMPGWEKSSGIQSELDFAKERGLDCAYVELSSASIQLLLDVENACS